MDMKLWVKLGDCANEYVYLFHLVTNLNEMGPFQEFPEPLQ